MEGRDADEHCKSGCAAANRIEHGGGEVNRLVVLTPFKAYRFDWHTDKTKIMTIKELQLLFETYRKRSRNWLIALGVAVILGFVLLFTVFKPKGEVDQSYKLEIERLQQKIELLEQSNILRDSIIAGHDQKLLENRKTETKIITRYERIPVDVRDLSREDLRKQVTDY